MGVGRHFQPAGKIVAGMAHVNTVENGVAAIHVIGIIRDDKIVARVHAHRYIVDIFGDLAESTNGREAACGGIEGAVAQGAQAGIGIGFAPGHVQEAGRVNGQVSQNGIGPGSRYGDRGGTAGRGYPEWTSDLELRAKSC